MAATRCQESIHFAWLLNARELETGAVSSLFDSVIQLLLFDKILAQIYACASWQRDRQCLLGTCRFRSNADTVVQRMDNPKFELGSYWSLHRNSLILCQYRHDIGLSHVWVLSVWVLLSHIIDLFPAGFVRFLVYTQFGQRLIMLVSTLRYVLSRSLWATTVFSWSIVGYGIKNLRSWPSSLFRLASLPQAICCSQTMIRETPTNFTALN